VPTAEILTIGNELLIGRIVNTNSTWLCRKLTYLGIKVRRVIVLPDEEEEIARGVRESITRGVDILLITGGLGPTFDDKTSQSLSLALKRPWVVNQRALRMIEKKYKERGLEMTEHRLKMAKMPEGAEPIPNPVGTAPGILIRFGKTLLIVLPGVPEEMKNMFEQYVEPLLKKVAPGVVFLEDQFVCRGLPESTIAPIIEKVMRKVHAVYIKSHPSGCELGKPVVIIHMYTSGYRREEAEDKLVQVKDELKRELIRAGAEIENS